MFTLRLPSFLIFGERPGLIVGDDQVSLVVWKGGNLRQVATFANDKEGVELFARHLEENPYRNRGFFVIANVLGEDYRHENVAHLSGPIKQSFHNKRMRQLFRGSPFCMSDTHGREKSGKREDIVLFFGVLVAAKIDPWLAAINEGGVRYLTGIHGMSHVTSYLRPLLPKAEGNSALVTFHENNMMRLTFFAGNNMRFGRVSKIENFSDTAELAAKIKTEVERTSQYLSSMRHFAEGVLTVDCICPGGVVEGLVKALPGNERYNYRFHAAEVMQERQGVKTPLAETGRDSALQVDAVCKRVIFRQLAPQMQMRHYWMQIGARAAVALFFAYGVYAYSSAAKYFIEGYATYSAENDKTEEVLNAEKAAYQSELESIAGKPSTGQNARAIASTYDAIQAKGLTPTRLLYYLSGVMKENNDISLNSVKWYVSPGAVAPAGDGAHIVSGNELYQILEISAQAEGNTQRQVVAQARQFVQSLDGRGDIFVEEMEMPPESLGVLADLDSTLDRDLVVRIIWREGEDFPESYDPREEARLQEEGA